MKWCYPNQVKHKRQWANGKTSVTVSLSKKILIALAIGPQITLLIIMCFLCDRIGAFLFCKKEQISKSYLGSFSYCLNMIEHIIYFFLFSCIYYPLFFNWLLAYLLCLYASLHINTHPHSPFICNKAVTHHYLFLSSLWEFLEWIESHSSIFLHFVFSD